MRFEFDSINELTEFFLFCVDLGAREPAAHEPAAHEPAAREVGPLREFLTEEAVAEAFAPTAAETARAKAFFGTSDAPLPEIAMPVSVAEELAEAPAPVEQKRKRRTKAEMEAARAAETAEEEIPTQPAPELGAANPFAQPMPTGNAPVENVESAPAVLSEAVATGDAPEFIKSRLGERPQVSQIDHLNMARTFIGKHGMDKYNQSFALAGLTNNVMGYSTADCATHAAALDFLSLE